DSTLKRAPRLFLTPPVNFASPSSHRLNPCATHKSKPPAGLLGHADGVESIPGADVHSIFADCRCCVDVGVEVVNRQNLPIAGGPQDDDLAMLTGDVDLAVDADR